MRRLGGCQHALHAFLSHAKKVFDSSEVKNAKVCIYGFGLRVKDMEVCDILTLLKCLQDNPPLSDKLYRQIGDDIGTPLLHTLTGLLAPYMISDVIEKARAEIADTGGTTTSVPNLSKLIPEGEKYLDIFDDYIYGGTPMQKALETIYERFERELAKEAGSVTPILCIVS